MRRAAQLAAAAAAEVPPSPSPGFDGGSSNKGDRVNLTLDLGVAAQSTVGTAIQTIEPTLVIGV